MQQNKNSNVLYFLSGLCFFLWWGGFTFYAAFVVPTGMNVLGSHVLMGFITQQVTVKLNIACAVAISFTFVYVLMNRSAIPFKLKRGMIINLAVMAVLLVFLGLLHSHMSTFLDNEAKKVINEPYFYSIHRIYLWTSTVMWVQGIVHMYQFLKLQWLKTE